MASSVSASSTAARWFSMSPALSITASRILKSSMALFLALIEAACAAVEGRRCRPGTSNVLSRNGGDLRVCQKIVAGEAFFIPVRAVAVFVDPSGAFGGQVQSVGEVVDGIGDGDELGHDVAPIRNPGSAGAVVGFG